MTFGNAWQVSMRGSSFNKEESGVGLVLEQHSTRLKGMMGCPFGCRYFVQRGGLY